MLDAGLLASCSLTRLIKKLNAFRTCRYHGVYNLEKPGEWKSIVDLAFLGCMLTPGGGKNDIPSRAKRHFHVMHVTTPSVASISQVIKNIASPLHTSLPAHLSLDVPFTPTCTPSLRISLSTYADLRLDGERAL